MAAKTYFSFLSLSFPFMLLLFSCDDPNINKSHIQTESSKKQSEKSKSETSKTEVPIPRDDVSHVYRGGFLLEPKLLQRIIDSHPAFFAESLKDAIKKGEDWELNRAVDYPNIPDHYYAEGYCTATPSAKPTPSLNPRTGSEMMKNAAPLPLRAFFHSFRKLNANWINEAARGHSCLERLVRENRVFADLAIQFHTGAPITENDMRWHQDNPNSILHLAMSVKGNRMLHLRSSDQRQRHRQVEGQFYIATPYSVEHAVEYFETDWENRVIAIQARLLVDEGDPLYTPECKPEAIVKTVSRVLLNANVRVPTLQDVLKAETELNAN